MVTPLYGQRKTVEQNNDIPLLQEHLSRKKTHKGQNHNIKKMHVIEMLHIEMSVVQPAATVQTPLKFRWPMVGYHLFKYRGCLHTSQETKESGYMDWCTGQALHGLVSSKDEDKDPAVLRQSDNLDDQSQFTSSLTGETLSGFCSQNPAQPSSNSGCCRRSEDRQSTSLSTGSLMVSASHSENDRTIGKIQLLSLALKAFELIPCIWLAGFTGTCFGQSLPMIIACQLPLENCKGESEMQPQAFTWLPGIVVWLSSLAATPAHSRGSNLRHRCRCGSCRLASIPPPPHQCTSRLLLSPL
ncbi:uncharacterized protein LOC111095647 isoform X2 [Canis lupus familiaris]|uniref:uncharacterized protein LOC111095647 isoform X2 n=1 Tax=Canis lupus familiaris TaxID=9615 RepID=UPI000BAA055F|nr:uncharacterized protein LOC111095647 isoform X2 [Canis lupus familiaris]XP_022273650.1 uncharacterized protein LOC111095647 isoform X2 [Canis lupus familiaris]XP_022273651.1 uncharacterized protein LOC111095647 isoform X2 [Canis lupus familiaris]XP_022273652.1 uncharacterized protein LOC111095647 isoform X2 [Canis lupus familiaris]XP_025292241.1 uncharacterized protein LOC112652840 isoform X1 [Canis lupus dingo]XP_025292242.1 uncharacterized protein LOC112652840 isoform X1 [Canis lupus ding|eukprot:XP_022273649.1 uncharacterized protein LOC111095647 isoform X1 [Canis lupus familiaris]